MAADADHHSLLYLLFPLRDSRALSAPRTVG